MKTIILSLMLIFSANSYVYQTDVENKADSKRREFFCKIERDGGRDAVDNFKLFVEEHQPSNLKVNLESKIQNGIIRSITLRMKGEEGLNVRIYSRGFDQFELHWKLDQEDKPYEIWYRFDDREKKPINLEDFIGRRKIKVKYISE